jgi:hypothetical protein
MSEKLPEDLKTKLDRVFSKQNVKRAAFYGGSVTAAYTLGMADLETLRVATESLAYHIQNFPDRKSVV